MNKYRIIEKKGEYIQVPETKKYLEFRTAC